MEDGFISDHQLGSERVYVVKRSVNPINSLIEIMISKRTELMGLNEMYKPGTKHSSDTHAMIGKSPDCSILATCVRHRMIGTGLVGSTGIECRVLKEQHESHPPVSACLVRHYIGDEDRGGPTDTHPSVASLEAENSSLSSDNQPAHHGRNTSTVPEL